MPFLWSIVQNCSKWWRFIAPPKNKYSFCLSWRWPSTFLFLYFFIFLPAVVAAPTPTKPQCCSRGFHRAIARFQDESRSDKPSSTYHEHYQAHSVKQDTATASSEDSVYEAETEETYRANTRSVETTVLGNVRIKHNVLHWFWSTSAASLSLNLTEKCFACS